ncbi:UDP-N-acetylmuramate--L-alanine ligase [Synechococcus sp. PCC 7502]|uniref:UDP-N-acetylmuramate--L-alanine ligase n=1 Tax=Synechococcus sp. PCC 7502 TaxID=1173263 RepID=UPI00029FFFD3|nr:UDP-N-acetylmuramate--L-alanine ligase [Synechococcus sp. PCC 7502]AFY73381.1 UDP-N-acetylmuramate--L-alanine ligase [Synechococcus sp. PCC 7502]
MLSPIDLSGKPFHFIGIGGIGMSAIAHILVRQGYKVSGSDLAQNQLIAQLQGFGAKIYQGHSADNIDLSNPPQIVCSTAISDQNPEFQLAKSQDLAILHRSDVLAALITQFQSVAIAGTHGKTTTSSLVAYLFLQAGLDPTIVVGGEVRAWQGNARLGKGKYLIAEADESDGSLTKFAPAVGIITNIELDHTDHYHSLAQVISTFQTFAQRCQVVITCIDCETTAQHIKADITYSLSNPDADYYAVNIEYGCYSTKATVIERGQVLGEVSLSILGKHNLSNALAAIAVARWAEISWLDIQTALPDFMGASRRFELKGKQNGVVFIDDYAHHPSEIRATLASAKLQSSHQAQHRVVAIFQPHRYSRTAKFLTEFSQAFGDADLVVVTDIYAAGEKNSENISGEQMAQEIASQHPSVHFQGDLDSVQTFLTHNLRSGDLAVFLGAGNLNRVIAPTIQALRNISP